MRVGSLGGEDSREEGMATHSSILAWRIPWTEEPGMLESVWYYINVGPSSQEIVYGVIRKVKGI